jgi:protein-S-isoprenylcysteine O-methyltransferase Ste14
MNAQSPPPRPSVAELLMQALDEIRGLLRRELDLARAEADRSLRKAGAAIGLLAAAMIVALVALNVLAAALVDALAALGLDPGWAALVVGLGLAVIAGAFAARAMRDLRAVRLAPERVADNLRQDARSVKEATRGTE